MTPLSKLSLGVLLTAAAGFADAVGFIELGGHFISFMSGNTTQLGNALAEGLWTTGRMTASLLALFFMGSVAGSLAANLAGARWASAMVTALVLASFAGTLLLAYLGLPAQQFMLILALGAGAQNAILPSVGSVRLGTTFVTGTLFTAGQDLARALCGLAPPWRWAQHMLVWASLLVGAVLGALSHRLFGIGALWFPALFYLVFLLVVSLRRPGAAAP